MAKTPNYIIRISPDKGNITTITKKLKEVFGEGVQVMKETFPTSRADRLSQAMDAVEEARSEVESLHDEIQEWHDNLPDALQSSQKGDDLDECASALDDVMNNLQEAIDNAGNVTFPGMY